MFERMTTSGFYYLCFDSLIYLKKQFILEWKLSIKKKTGQKLEKIKMEES